MADNEKYTLLNDTGVKTLALEIFKLIKDNYATTEAMNIAIDNLEARLNSTDVLLALDPKIDADGNLTITYPDGEPEPALVINEAGYAVLTDSGSDTDAKIAKLQFEITEDGYLTVSA